MWRINGRKQSKDRGKESRLLQYNRQETVGCSQLAAVGRWEVVRLRILLKSASVGFTDRLDVESERKGDGYGGWCWGRKGRQGWLLNFSLSKSKDQIAIYWDREDRKGNKFRKIIFRQVKVKILIRHLVEKPVCYWTYRSNGGEVQAGGRNVGDFSV